MAKRKRCVVCNTNQPIGDLCLACRMDGWKDLDELQRERIKEAFISACVCLRKLVFPPELWNSEILSFLEAKHIPPLQYYTPLQIVFTEEPDEGDSLSVAIENNQLLISPLEATE